MVIKCKTTSSAKQPNSKADHGLSETPNPSLKIRSKSISTPSIIVKFMPYGSIRDRDRTCCRLLDGDLASLVLLGLGDNNVEDTVLHGRLDVLGVDADREGERSREFADAALGNPVLLLKLGRFVLLIDDIGMLCGSLGCENIDGVVFVLDSCLMSGWGLITFGDRARGFGRFKVASWWRTRCVGALCTTADYQGLRICEFDFHVALLHTGKFSVEFVGPTSLLDVELGAKCLHDVATTVVMSVVIGSAAPRVGVEVVKESEERMEGGGIVGDEGFREERHFARVSGSENYSLCLTDWKS